MLHPVEKLAKKLALKQDKRYRTGCVYNLIEYDPDAFEKCGFKELGSFGWRDYKFGGFIDLVTMKVLDYKAAMHYQSKDKTGRFC